MLPVSYPCFDIVKNPTHTQTQSMWKNHSKYSKKIRPIHKPNQIEKKQSKWSEFGRIPACTSLVVMPNN